MSSSEILSILEEARSLRDHARGDELNGCVIANLFFENSTRTRCSFETAAIRLGGHPINLSASGSSVAKGETLVDTALQFDAMGGDVIVVRSGLNGGAELVAEACDAAVINAGDGRHEHPTQALLDALALREALAEQFGVSRTVVREAVSRLKSLGLVDSRQGSGVYVRAAGVEPLRFEQPHLSAELGEVVAQLRLDALDGALLVVRRDDVVRPRIDGDTLELLENDAPQGVDRRDAIDLVACDACL